MNFLIQNYTDHKFPSFNRPEVIGYFSLVGEDRLYTPDLSQLKYYNGIESKRVRFDLNQGIERVIRKPVDLDERIDHLLRWIIQNHLKIKSDIDNKWLRPDFVCYRGLLTKICNTPYEDRDGWIICAVKLFGTIYLCEFDTEEKKQRKTNPTQRDLKFSSWGFKFEQYMLSDSPNNTPNTNDPVNEGEEFNCVLSTKLGQNVLLYGAEMDGVETKDIVKEPVDWKNIKFVELKTNKRVQNYREDFYYRKKQLKWWCQSFLVGVDNIICGTRSNDGIVYDLEKLKVSDIPKSCKDQWNATNCMNFCDAFLNHLKTVVIRDYDKCIYKFEFKLRSIIEIGALPKTSEFAFLPKWFVDEASKIANKSF